MSALSIYNPSEHGSSDDSRCSSFRLQHFIDAETLAAPDRTKLHSARVLQAILGQHHGRFSEIRKGHQTETAYEANTLLTYTLPTLSKERQLGELSQHLANGDLAVQTPAAEFLETLLLEVPQSQDLSKTKDLLKVADNTLNTFLQTSDENDQAFLHVYLHMMSLSVLLNHNPGSSGVVPCSEFLARIKQAKKHKPNTSPLNQTIGRPQAEKHKPTLYRGMLKALSKFHKSLKDGFSKGMQFTDWIGMTEAEMKSRLQRTSFCAILVGIFILFNKVLNQGLESSSLSALEAIRNVHNALGKVGKTRSSDKVKPTIDYVLVKGLVMLLRTTIRQDYIPLGEQPRPHAKLISNLLLNILKEANTEHTKCLQAEVSYLPFHSVKCVRQNFAAYFQSIGYPELQLVMGYAERSLRTARLKTESFSALRSLVPEKDEAQSTVCSWYTSRCTMGETPAEISVYVPKARCMVDDQLDKCISEHHGESQELKERSKRHTNNVDFLMRLSPNCSHFLQLLAYQWLPLPFYVTEPVHNRRLLDYLLKKRGSQNWLRNSVLVHVTIEILQALAFLAEHGIVSRDVTTYNMIVEVPKREGEPRGIPRGSLKSTCTVKLADLGLAHKYRNNENIELCSVMDQGPIPVRWTAPEALSEGRHTDKSMVYSVGCVMYELWTHGCQPFTYHDAWNTTEEILKKVLTSPNSVPLHHWDCIPDDVYGVIQRCTHSDPVQRPSLTEMTTDWSKEFTSARASTKEDPSLDTALRLRANYPPLSPDQQKRINVPETGISSRLKEFIGQLGEAGRQAQLFNNPAPRANPVDELYLTPCPEYGGPTQQGQQRPEADLPRPETDKRVYRFTRWPSQDSLSEEHDQRIEYQPPVPVPHRIWHSASMGFPYEALGAEQHFGFRGPLTEDVTGSNFSQNAVHGNATSFTGLQSLSPLQRLQHPQQDKVNAELAGRLDIIPEAEKEDDEDVELPVDEEAVYVDASSTGVLQDDEDVELPVDEEAVYVDASSTGVLQDDEEVELPVDEEAVYVDASSTGVLQVCANSSEERTAFISELQKQLTSASNFVQFVETASRYEGRLNELTLPTKPTAEPVINDWCCVDQDARRLLPENAPDGRLPVSTEQDGNCLPRSLSKAVYGTETHHNELRVRIACEMALRKDRYLDPNYMARGTSLNGHDVIRICALQGAVPCGGSKDEIHQAFNKECMVVSASGAFMGIWQLQVAADVLQRRVISVYPDKGTDHVDRQLVHRTFHPATETSAPIYIMWSNTRRDLRSQNWIANHFVPLMLPSASVHPSSGKPAADPVKQTGAWEGFNSATAVPEDVEVKAAAFTSHSSKAKPPRVITIDSGFEKSLFELSLTDDVFSTDVEGSEATPSLSLTDFPRPCLGEVVHNPLYQSDPAGSLY